MKALVCFIISSPLFLLSCKSNSSTNVDADSSKEDPTAPPLDVNIIHPHQDIVALDLAPSQIGPDWKRAAPYSNEISKFRYQKGNNGPEVSARIVWMGGSQKADSALKERMALPGYQQYVQHLCENPLAYSIESGAMLSYTMSRGGFWLIVEQEAKGDDLREDVFRAYEKRLREAFEAVELNPTEHPALTDSTIKPHVVSDVSPLPALSEISVSSVEDYEIEVYRTKITWVGHGEYDLVFQTEESWSTNAKQNYSLIRERWPAILTEIAKGVEEQIISYEKEAYWPIPGEGYFFITIPEEPISEAEATFWTCGVECEPTWVVDFEGWTMIGGQGVF
ncbi:MAG: hypothetical protein ACSHYF_05615 [Verrucomicrobiaceae bacterium]